MTTISDDDFSLVLAAAESGDPQAMIMIGSIYYKGIGREVDLDRALSWFHRASKTSDIEALRKLSAEINLNTVKHTKVPKLRAAYLNESEMRKNIQFELVSIKLNSSVVGRIIYKIICFIYEFLKFFQFS